MTNENILEMDIVDYVLSLIAFFGFGMLGANWFYYQTSNYQISLIFTIQVISGLILFIVPVSYLVCKYVFNTGRSKDES